ncbi:glycosyl hydrolase family 18 protein [Catenuloplanes japonicus]|uniref:glycosyl hydrolase family 18 protein n=1 Tax=Catenuloplanes japonicus TaxID=33876 RepID=UPI000526DE3F|nr:glycosyl hydrolase family 18 protein [Catenuloplanes japonicus]
MRRSVRRGLLAGAVVAALAATAVPVANAMAAGSIAATFTASSDWGTGHEVAVKVTNGSDAAVATWSITFTLPSSASISSSWDADVTKSGNTYTAVKKSWQGSLAPGASVTWGYIATGAYAAPSSCTINGVTCAGGTTPPTTAPPTTTPPTTTPPTTPPPTTTPPTTPPPNTGGKKVVGYFAEWGVYDRNYHVKNIDTSGSAAKLTHILYAFGNTTGGRCSVGETFPAYEKSYTADQSVSGVADTWDQPLRGSFNQLRQLKAKYPHLKIIYSFGGWTWSGGFTQAAQNPTAFAESCYNVVEDPRWADVFDGIDIDWEYPNACGLSCDASGPNAYKNVISALRTKFGANALITSAITADGSNGGKIDVTDYAGAINNLNWLMPMTYDYFGAFAAQGPTAPHSPLTSYNGIPTAGFNSDAAIQKLKSKGIPADKLLLGVGFYGRGWTGVTQSAPGGAATGPAAGKYEPGINDYKVLKDSCPATGTVGGTAYAYCGNNWWSYDTPATMTSKMSYAKTQGLGGAFFWELSGDTTNGELITAVKNGLN